MGTPFPVGEVGLTMTDRSGVIHGTATSPLIVNPGTGGTNGAAILTSVGGSGTPFQVNATIAGGVLTALGSFVTGGDFSAAPANLAAVAVTGGGLTGATISVAMVGLATEVMAANPQRRVYRYQPTSVTAYDHALNDVGNGVAPLLTTSNVSAGAQQVPRMTGAISGNGFAYAFSSVSAIYAYNALAFATYTASEGQ